MPARLLLALATVLVSVAGCAGGDDEAAQPKRETQARLLDERSFRSIVEAAVRRDDEVAVEAFAKLTVRVEKDEDWIELALGDAYASYRRDPGRRDAIVRGIAADVQRRLERGVDGASFAAVRAELRPLLRPRFAVRKLSDRPAQRPFPGNLVVLYGVQREREFFLLRPDDLARWGRGVAEVGRIAAANLARESELLCEPAGKEKLCGWASGDGYDAARMTVPELRRQIVREVGGPAAYAVPTEHLFVAVRIGFAERIAPKVLRDFTTSKDPVSPAIFAERNGELAVLRP